MTRTGTLSIRAGNCGVAETCLIHINDYCRGRIVLESSKTNAQHSCLGHYVVTILYQHCVRLIERLLWKLE